MILLLILSGLFLAFANGANDNFKGVATLFGSKTASSKIALTWATLTTFAGSCVALFLAHELVSTFSGKGLVPDEVVQLSSFTTSVAMAAAITVYLATRLGFPISTTHALTGALVGSGLLASSAGVNVNKLFGSFFLPLLLSPFLAIALTLILYPLFSYLRKKMGISRKSCLCIGNEVISTAPAGIVDGSASQASLQMTSFPSISIGTQVTCEQRYVGQMGEINAKSFLDSLHFFSAGLVSFARGLNDTPKIAAILLVTSTLSPIVALSMVGVVMAVGGILMSRKVAQKMSLEITEMNDGQGFTANFITSLIVTGASLSGMPVSTTHVSCGALFGIGSVTKQARWMTIFKIVNSWIITLPVAAALGYVSFLLLRSFE
ncbi:MAG: anion permease [Bdellovibrionales bacterium]|nr:anion permease [Bdellovibrionales bacterium]